MSTKATWAVSIAFGIAAACLIFVGLWSDATAFGGLLLNLGTEVLGILVTLLVVDRLILRQHYAGKAHSIAHAAARDLDTAVWHWLCGNRRFSLDETLSLLETVTADEPIHDLVRRKLVQLGTQAEHTGRVETATLNRFPELQRALGRIATLANLADGPRPDPQNVAENLRVAMQGYAAVLKHQPVKLKVSGRDSSLEGQERRCEARSGGKVS